MDTPIYTLTAMEHELVHLLREIDGTSMPVPFEDTLYVAGAEARAIVRAGMRDIRRWIGEVE